MNAANGQADRADRAAGMDDAPQPPGWADIADARCAMTEDHNRIAHDVNDILVRRMFVVSLGLYAALSSIEHDTDHRYAAEKIRHAITGLDQAINELRNAVVELTTSATAPDGASEHELYELALLPSVGH
jgi:signal transduction histidine kinase